MSIFGIEYDMARRHHCQQVSSVHSLIQGFDEVANNDVTNPYRKERNLDEALIFAQKCFIFGPKREESKMVIKEIAAVREKENEMSRSMAKSQSTNRLSLKLT